MNGKVGTLISEVKFVEMELVLFLWYNAPFYWLSLKYA